MAELQVTLEFSVELVKFFNIDLFQRGFYQIRSYLRPSTKTPTRVDVAYQKGLNSGAQVMYPACVLNGSAASKTFQVLYRNEEIALNDVIIYRVEMLVNSQKVTETLERAEFQLILELWFSEQNTVNQPTGVMCVSSRTLRLGFSPFHGLHYHLPVWFDYFHLCAVSVSIHGSLLAIHQAVATDSAKRTNVGPGWTQTTHISIESLFSGAMYGKCLDFGSSRIIHACRMHKELCTLLASAHDTLARTALNFVENLRASDKLSCCVNETPKNKGAENGHRLQCTAKLRILGQELESTDWKSSKIRDVEELVALDDEERAFALMEEDIVRLCAKNLQLWQRFQEAVTHSEPIRALMGRHNYLQRVKRFAEGFFIVDNPRQSMAGCYDCNYQNYILMADHVRRSKYFCLLPRLTVECLELDGDSTLIPIIFEDQYQDVKEFARRRSVATHSSDSSKQLEFEGTSFDVSALLLARGALSSAVVCGSDSGFGSSVASRMSSTSTHKRALADLASIKMEFPQDARTTSTIPKRREPALGPRSISLSVACSSPSCQELAESAQSLATLRRQASSTTSRSINSFPSRKSASDASDSVVRQFGTFPSAPMRSKRRSMTVTSRRSVEGSEFPAEEHKNAAVGGEMCPGCILESQQRPETVVPASNDVHRSTADPSGVVSPTMKCFTFPKPKQGFKKKFRVESTKTFPLIASPDVGNRSPSSQRRRRLNLVRSTRESRSAQRPSTTSSSSESVVLTGYKRIEHSLSYPFNLCVGLLPETDLSTSVPAKTPISVSTREEKKKKPRRRSASAVEEPLSSASSGKGPVPSKNVPPRERVRQLIKKTTMTYSESLPNLNELPDMAVPRKTASVSMGCLSSVSRGSSILPRKKRSLKEGTVVVPGGNRALVEKDEDSSDTELSGWASESSSSSLAGDEKNVKSESPSSSSPSPVEEKVEQKREKQGQLTNGEIPLPPPVEFRDFGEAAPSGVQMGKKTVSGVKTAQTASHINAIMPALPPKEFRDPLPDVPRQGSPCSKPAVSAFRLSMLKGVGAGVVDDADGIFHVYEPVETVESPRLTRKCSCSSDSQILTNCGIVCECCASRHAEAVRDSSSTSASPAVTKHHHRHNHSVAASTVSVLGSAAASMPSLNHPFSSLDVLGFLRAKEEFRAEMKLGPGSMYSDYPVSSTTLPYFHVSDESRVFHPAGLHVIVCVHGLDGNAADLRLVRAYMEIGLPGCNLEFIMSERNQGDTFSDFDTMTDRLVGEILHHLESSQLKPARLSFVGHSLGTVLIRSCLTRPQMKPLLPKLHTFLSLSGPHLGTLYNSSGLVNMGLWFMQKVKKSGSLLQLSLKDHPDPRKTFLYKLAKESQLHQFKYILLCGSGQDRYVPMHSARIELCKAAARDSSIIGSAMREMVTSILQPIIMKQDVTLVRYDVHHALPATANSLIGRAAHIAVLDSELFIEKFLLVSALKYFE